MYAIRSYYEAMLVDVERGYRSLTGLDVKPALFVEQLTGRQGFDDSHPRLALADAEIMRARAELDLTQRTASGTPRLTISYNFV